MPSVHNRSILIVEDDAGIAELEKHRLEEAGYRIQWAPNAKEALRLLRFGDIQLILLDYRLPNNVDGLTFYSQIQSQGIRLPVILVTGYGDEPTLIQALRMGVRDFVTKSVEYLDYLPEAVGRVLKQIETENQLIESENRLASIIATATDAVLVTNEEGEITLFNPAAEIMFGCPSSVAIGRSLTQFFLPSASCAAIDVEKEVYLVTGSLCVCISRGLRSNSEEFSVEVSVSHYVGADGQRFNTLVVRDISERKRVERTLEKERQFLSALLESLDSAIVACDSDGKLMHLNRVSREFLGSVATSAPCASWLDLIELYDNASGRRLSTPEFPLYRALRGEYVHDAELTLRAQGNPERTVVMNARPVQDDGGHTLGAVVTAQDVTEKKRTEQRLLEQAAMLEQARDAIIVHDMDGAITFWNQGAEKLYGWSAAESVGMNAHQLYHHLGLDSLREARQRVLETGEWAAELTHIRKDGSPVNVSSRWTLMRDQRDAPRAILVISTDITDKKRLESQLLHSQRMEAVGVLAGGVAHDFNNLLTVILGYCDLLSPASHLTGADREILGQISRAGEQAAALTRQLLAFSRKQVLAPQIVDLSAIVGRMEKLLSRLIGPNIDLVMNFAENAGHVRVDPNQLEQVLMNLVMNARDAMPQGGRLTIESAGVELGARFVQSHLEFKPGHYVRLSIRDTGTGMDAATQARLFEPFFTTKEIGKGTGLGLATVHGIIEQSGGHIDVESEIGKGSTFHVYLPRLEQRAAADSAASATLNIPRGVETILLADDDDGIRNLARSALSSYGYSVLEAADGVEGVRVAAEYEGNIDLLIADVVMPRMGGREMVEKVISLYPKARVLHISGYTDDAIVRHGVLTSGVAFLQKPFTPSTLARKVREILDSVP